MNSTIYVVDDKEFASFKEACQYVAENWIYMDKQDFIDLCEDIIKEK